MKYINNKRTGWQVGDKFFDNKWHAVQYATDNPLPYNVYCQNSTWDKVDWTIEPEQDIKQLEKNHAKYLRDKYETLLLFFSGGVDSNTVLDTFIKNKIPLDYICLWYVDKYETSYNKDIHLAMTYLKENESKLMGAKILCEKKLEHFEGNSIYNFEKPIHNVNFQLRFHHNSNTKSLELRNLELYKKVKENGCIITGANKPYVYKDKKGFYTQSMDVEDESWGDYYTEMFWMGEDPILYIKQCHLAKQWLEEHDLTATNQVYKSNDVNKFWELNQHFGRMSIDKFFFQKHCFADYIDDEYFGQHYGRDWGNSHWANYFKHWQYTDSYNNLKEELEKISEKFVESYKLQGWITEKRYLE
jgi:hypothetical protein